MTNSEPPEQCEALNVFVLPSHHLRIVDAPPCTYPQQARLPLSALVFLLSKGSPTRTWSPRISEVRAPPAGPAQTSPKRQ